MEIGLQGLKLIILLVKTDKSGRVVSSSLLIGTFVSVAGHTLLFANHSEADVILRAELQYMLAGHYVDVLKTPEKNSEAGRLIDLELLRGYAAVKSNFFYICGPDLFVSDMAELLEILQVDKAHMVLEA